jgi:hypothetical protein
MTNEAIMLPLVSSFQLNRPRLILLARSLETTALPISPAAAPNQFRQPIRQSPSEKLEKINYATSGPQPPNDEEINKEREHYGGGT